jgi:hypothetical protein
MQDRTIQIPLTRLSDKLISELCQDQYFDRHLNSHPNGQVFRNYKRSTAQNAASAYHIYTIESLVVNQTL